MSLQTIFESKKSKVERELLEELAKAENGRDAMIYSAHECFAYKAQSIRRRAIELGLADAGGNWPKRDYST